MVSQIGQSNAPLSILSSQGILVDGDFLDNKAASLLLLSIRAESLFDETICSKSFLNISFTSKNFATYRPFLNQLVDLYRQGKVPNDPFYLRLTSQAALITFSRHEYNELANRGYGLKDIWEHLPENETFEVLEKLLEIAIVFGYLPSPQNEVAAKIVFIKLYYLWIINTQYPFQKDIQKIAEFIFNNKIQLLPEVLNKIPQLIQFGLNPVSLKGILESNVFPYDHKICFVDFFTFLYLYGDFDKEFLHDLVYINFLTQNDWDEQTINIVIDTINKEVISVDTCVQLILRFISNASSFLWSKQSISNEIKSSIFLLKKLSEHYEFNFIEKIGCALLNTSESRDVRSIFMSLESKGFPVLNWIFKQRLSLEKLNNAFIEGYLQSRKHNIYFPKENTVSLICELLGDETLYHEEHYEVYLYFLPVLSTLENHEIAEIKLFDPSIEGQISYFLTKAKESISCFTYDSNVSNIEIVYKIRAKIEKKNQHDSLLGKICIKYLNFIDREAIVRIPDSPGLSFFASLLNSPRVCKKSLINYFLHEFSRTQKIINFAPLIHLFFTHPEIGMNFAKHALKVHSVFIGTCGWSRYNFSHVLALLSVKNKTTNNNKPLSAFGKEIRKAYSKKPKTIKVIKEIEALKVYSKEHHTIRGRSIEVRPSQKESLYDVYKFITFEETEEDFIREFYMTRCFTSEEKYLSKLHTPIKIFYLNKLPEWIENIPIVRNQDSILVYHYKASEGYSTYLHNPNISDPDRKKARFHFCRDYGLEIREGYYAVPADLFHNENDKRIYHILVDHTQLAIQVQYGARKQGAGRLDKWYDAVKYPNGGLLGRRDVGDGVLRENAVNSFFSQNPPEVGTENYLEMDALAKVILVDALLTLRRYKDQNRLNWQDIDFVNEFAETLQECQIWLLMGYLNQSYEKCHAFVNSGAIDYVLAAKQLIFWTQTDLEGYPKNIQAGTIPEEIYPDVPIVEAFMAKFALNFNPLNGFGKNEMPDIGAFNGPLACTEFEKSIFWITFVALGCNL